jgi:hypothetical protein
VLPLNHFCVLNSYRSYLAAPIQSVHQEFNCLSFIIDIDIDIENYMIRTWLVTIERTIWWYMPTIPWLEHRKVKVSTAVFKIRISFVQTFYDYLQQLT